MDVRRAGPGTGCCRCLVVCLYLVLLCGWNQAGCAAEHTVDVAVVGDPAAGKSRLVNSLLQSVGRRSKAVVGPWIQDKPVVQAKKRPWWSIVSFATGPPTRHNVLLFSVVLRPEAATNTVLRRIGPCIALGRPGAACSYFKLESGRLLHQHLCLKDDFTPHQMRPQGSDDDAATDTSACGTFAVDAELPLATSANAALSGVTSEEYDAATSTASLPQFVCSEVVRGAEGRSLLLDASASADAKRASLVKHCRGVRVPPSPITRSVQRHCAGAVCYLDMPGYSLAACHTQAFYDGFAADAAHKTSAEEAEAEAEAEKCRRVTAEDGTRHEECAVCQARADRVMDHIVYGGFLPKEGGGEDKEGDAPPDGAQYAVDFEKAAADTSADISPVAAARTPRVRHVIVVSHTDPTAYYARRYNRSAGDTEDTVKFWHVAPTAMPNAIKLNNQVLRHIFPKAESDGGGGGGSDPSVQLRGRARRGAAQAARWTPRTMAVYGASFCVSAAVAALTIVFVLRASHGMSPEEKERLRQSQPVSLQPLGGVTDLFYRVLSAWKAAKERTTFLDQLREQRLKKLVHRHLSVERRRAARDAAAEAAAAEAAAAAEVAAEVAAAGALPCMVSATLRESPPRADGDGETQYFYSVQRKNVVPASFEGVCRAADLLSEELTGKLRAPRTPHVPSLPREGTCTHCGSPARRHVVGDSVVCDAAPPPAEAAPEERPPAFDPAKPERFLLEKKKHAACLAVALKAIPASDGGGKEGWWGLAYELTPSFLWSPDVGSMSSLVKSKLDDHSKGSTLAPAAYLNSAPPSPSGSRNGSRNTTRRESSMSPGRRARLKYGITRWLANNCLARWLRSTRQYKAITLRLDTVTPGIVKRHVLPLFGKVRDAVDNGVVAVRRCMLGIDTYFTLQGNRLNAYVTRRFSNSKRLVSAVVGRIVMFVQFLSKPPSPVDEQRFYADVQAYMKNIDLREKSRLAAKQAATSGTDTGGFFSSSSPRDRTHFFPPGAESEHSSEALSDPCDPDLSLWEPSDPIARKIGRSHSKIGTTGRLLQEVEQNLVAIADQDISFLMRPEKDVQKRSQEREMKEGVLDILKARLSNVNLRRQAGEDKLANRNVRCYATQTPHHLSSGLAAQQQQQQHPRATPAALAAGSRGPPRALRRRRMQASRYAEGRHRFGLLGKMAGTVVYAVWPWYYDEEEEERVLGGYSSDSSDATEDVAGPFVDPDRTPSVHSLNPLFHHDTGMLDKLTDGVPAPDNVRRQLRKQKAKPLWATLAGDPLNDSADDVGDQESIGVDTSVRSEIHLG